MVTSATVPLSLIVLYGVCRIGASVCNEGRNAIFAKVGQNAIRRIACDTFDHLLSCDAKFHLSRQTGSIARLIDRGSRGINSVMNAFVFNLLPTCLEVVLVIGILGWTVGWEYSCVSVVTMIGYVAYTVGLTGWRMRIRQEMNAADNKGMPLCVCVCECV